MAQKNVVGVDIGSNSIKLVNLKENRQGVHLQAFDMAMLPPETVVDGALLNFTAIVEKLKEMIYFMYNYVQQKEKIEKQHDASTDGSDTSSSEKTSKAGNSSSLMSSPGSLQSPGSRSSLSDTSGSSPYGLLQMVNDLEL